ncbi:MAG: hypothetical protein MJ245_05155 [Clostridia bacterium]|nr:hypothetical protein [Clostridia bacterium]
MKEKTTKFYRIYFDNDYDTEEYKSNRLLLRLFRKYGFSKQFIDDGKPYLLAYEFDGKYYEMLTDVEINGRAERIKQLSVYHEINDLGMRNFLLYFAIVEYALGINNHEFNDDEVTTMEEAAQDRAIQFDAYQKGLTTINPYDRDQINNFNANKKIVKLKK